VCDVQQSGFALEPRICYNPSAFGGTMEIALAVVGVILAAIGFVEHYD
jgi:hypothetical protein